MSVNDHASNESNASPEATMARFEQEEHYSATIVQSESSTPEAFKKGRLGQYKINQGLHQAEHAFEPRFLRQSDNQLVHLHCRVIGCNSSYFGTVISLMSHISSPKHHDFR